jgi:predicted dienelactone hydrolase
MREIAARATSRDLRRRFLSASLLLFTFSPCLAQEENCQRQCQTEAQYNAPDKVGAQTKVFFDPVRGRPLITEVFYPVESTAVANREEGIWQRAGQAREAPIARHGTKLPFLLVSHGDSGSRMDTSWLAEYLAANGFIVASVDHYGNTSYLNIGEVRVRPWERPLDISFVLSEMMKDPDFGWAIDENRIGFIGFSLGGLTGLWLAGATAMGPPPMGAQPAGGYTEADRRQADRSYREPLIQAMILLSPAGAQSIDVQSLKSIHVPVLIIAGAADDVTPIAPNAIYLSQNITGAEIKVLEGAGHFSFLNIPTPPGIASLPPRYVTDEEGVTRAWIHAQTAVLSLCFFRCNLPPTPATSLEELHEQTSGEHP